MLNTSEIVLEYFAARGGLPGETLGEKFACAYLDEKLIDSMGIIDMVSHFEDRFGIRFEADDLLSQEFQTVGGLVGLIDRLRNSVS